MFLFSNTLLDNKMFLENDLYNSLKQNSEYRSDCYFSKVLYCRISSVRY